MEAILVAYKGTGAESKGATWQAGVTSTNKETIYPIFIAFSTLFSFVLLLICFMGVARKLSQLCLLLTEGYGDVGHV